MALGVLTMTIFRILAFVCVGISAFGARLRKRNPGRRARIVLGRDAQNREPA